MTEPKEAPFSMGNAPGTISARHAAMIEDTVKMNFPHRVLLTLRDHSRILFEKGVNDVPKSLVDHMYLRANGVKLIEGTMPAAKPIATDAAQAKAFQDRKDAIAHVTSRGYSPEAAVKIIDEHGTAKILLSKLMDEKEDAEDKRDNAVRYLMATVPNATEESAGKQVDAEGADKILADAKASAEKAAAQATLDQEAARNAAEDAKKTKSGAGK